MEEINASHLCSEVDETLNRFRLLEKSFKENLVKERHRFEETVEAYDKQFAELSETKNALLKKIQLQSNTISEYEKKLSKSNQSSISHELSNYKIETETLSKGNEELQALVNQKRALLEEIKVENKSRRASVLENEVKNKAELMAYVKYTHLDISPEKDNYIKFSFKSISQADPEKIFYFVLYLSESNVFQVTECQPEVPGIHSLLAKVNSDRDICSFVKRMRRAFVEINEFSSSSHAPPKEI